VCVCVCVCVCVSVILIYWHLCFTLLEERRGGDALSSLITSARLVERAAREGKEGNVVVHFGSGKLCGLTKPPPPPPQGCT